MSDDAERFFELRDEVDSQAKMFADASARAVPASFTDEAGLVTAQIDEDGVLSVEIADRWRDGIEPSALGDRIVAAFQGLSAARVEAWAANIGDAAEQDHRPSPIPSTHDSVAARLQEALLAEPETTPAVERALENMLAFLDDVSANIDATFAGALSRGRQTEEVAPLSRHLTVELSAGGHLVAVSLSPNWAERSSGAQISRELNDTLREAFEKTRATRDAGALDGSPLEKYGRFVDDPDAFVAFVSGKE
ncbi:hypothetical protein AB0O70_09775 [Microbacterium paraoxydans]|jgi:hypothetical protein|uniref:hypothetical protein n=1 Tax=Microbacterium TaxID=33882 RepID=UPI000D01F91E|nr:hypothetical protein [Microbacterium sp. str. 'China']AVL96037.1 hypothetical protein C6C15_02320 [Microbacterium sp. str. 'China']